VYLAFSLVPGIRPHQKACRRNVSGPEPLMSLIQSQSQLLLHLFRIVDRGIDVSEASVVYRRLEFGELASLADPTARLRTEIDQNSWNCDRQTSL
jgi:hypothetical protein